MQTEIANKQKCIFIRNGIEIWIDEKKANVIETDLLRGISNNFIKAGDRIINVKEVVGIFSPEDLDDLKRRKNGQWKCEFSVWHQRGEHCNCKEIENAKEHNKKNTERMKEMSENLTDEQVEHNRKKMKDMKDKIFNNKNVW